MQNKRKRSIAERKSQTEAEALEKAKIQERLLALDILRKSQDNGTLAREKVCNISNNFFHGYFAQ